MLNVAVSGDVLDHTRSIARHGKLALRFPILIENFPLLK